MTLIEVLLALAVLIAALSLMAGFSARLANSRQRLLEHGDRQACIDAIIDRAALAMDTTAVTAGGQPGLIGSAHMVTMMVAQDRPDASIGKALAAWRPVTIEHDQIERTVKIGGGLSVPLGDLRFRYFDGSTWQDEWNSSERGALPVAMMVEAWIRTGSNIDPSDAQWPPDRMRVLSVAGTWRQTE